MITSIWDALERMSDDPVEKFDRYIGDIQQEYDNKMQDKFEERMEHYDR